MHENFDRLLQDIQDEPESLEQRISLAYHELRRMARTAMAHHRPGVTLQPTALVNEAYLRLAQGETEFESSAHFFGAAARAMRQVMVAYARKRNALKRAGEAERITFQDLHASIDGPDLDVLALNEALAALEAQDASLCRLLELRYFAGFTLDEIAGLLGTSLASVKRDWSYARSWLARQLTER